MTAVYRKELKSFWGSLSGWLFIAVNLFFSGWYFRYYGLIMGYPYIAYVCSNITIIIILSLPFITMRSISEEMRLRTDQLLFTSPVPIWKVVVGKYLALLTIFAIPVAVMSIYPLIMCIFGNVPIAENYVTIFGYLLFGGACLAIGLLLSSLSDNQIIAAVLTFFVLLLGVMMPGICSLISTSGNMITKILGVFNLTEMMDDYFFTGIISIPAIVYYLSIIVLCLFLTLCIIGRKRWSFMQKGVLANVSAALVFIVVFTIVILINAFVRGLPQDAMNIDVTYNGIYSLTDESETILDNLEQEVTIYYLVDTDKIDTTIEQTLQDIDDYSKKVKVKQISPTENPYFYTEYADAMPNQNSVIVVSGDKSRVVDYYDCYEMTYEYEYDYDSASYVVTDYSVVGYDGEGRVMAAVLYVCENYVPQIYCITGHDEFEIQPGLRTQIEKANMNINYINLLTYDAVPEDAACLFILGALSDFSDNETQMIADYLSNGGNAIFMLAYSDYEDQSNLYSLLEPYNIYVNPGLVMEQGTSYYNSQPFYLLPDILENELTEGVYTYSRTKYIYMPYSKGLTITEDYGDVSVTPLLQTTAGAYLLTDVSDTEQTSYESARYILGAYMEKTYADYVSRVVVIASDYYLYDNIDDAVAGNNYTLFMNCLSKLTGTDIVSVVPVKSYDETYNEIIIDNTFISVFSWIFVGIIPVCLFICGLVIWIKRRKK